MQGLALVALLSLLGGLVAIFSALANETMTDYLKSVLKVG